MKLFLTIAGSAILGGLAAFSLCMAIVQLTLDYMRLAGRNVFIAGL
jgi:hypothetical protein